MAKAKAKADRRTPSESKVLADDVVYEAASSDAASVADDELDQFFEDILNCDTMEDDDDDNDDDDGDDDDAGDIVDGGGGGGDGHNRHPHDNNNDTLLLPSGSSEDHATNDAEHSFHRSSWRSQHGNMTYKPPHFLPGSVVGGSPQKKSNNDAIPHDEYDDGKAALADDGAIEITFDEDPPRSQQQSDE